MLKKILLIVVMTAICVFYLDGCKKRSGESEEPVVKTKAEYSQEAKEQITEENMELELEKIEKELNAEVSQEK